MQVSDGGEETGGGGTWGPGWRHLWVGKEDSGLAPQGLNAGLASTSVCIPNPEIPRAGDTQSR